MSVFTPGVTRCRTVTPVPSTSRRSASLKATTPAFAAAYVVVAGKYA
jgi:hypothetical protein